MAFGYVREKGSARGYVHADTGARLSRRQYDKFVEQMGARKTVPKPSLAAFYEAERKHPPDRVTMDSYSRHQAQQAGQRRYNTALELYARNERARGRRATKRELRSDDEFKRIMTDIKGKKVRKGDHTARAQKIRRQNEASRAAAFRLLKDRHGDEFREIYKQHDITVVDDDGFIQSGRTRPSIYDFETGEELE